MESATQLFKALAEPARLRLLALLLRGERCVCELMAVLDMPQSTVSRHLAYLKNAGLISGRRQSVWMYYRLAESTSEFHKGLVDLLNSHLAEIPQAKNDLAALTRYETDMGDKKC